MIRAFLRSRGCRKLLRSKLAVAALLVILAYLGVASAIGFAGAVTMDDTLKRVGPPNLRGFSLSGTPAERLETASFYLEAAGEAVEEEEPERRKEALGMSGIELAPLAADDFLEKVDAGWELVDEIDAAADLSAPEVDARLTQLSELVDSLFVSVGKGIRERDFVLLLGTDRQGRSILLRGLFSIKVAIQVGLVAALVSVTLGGLLGAAAAFFGGWVDLLVIWLYSTFSSIPYLVLLAVLAYAFTGTRWEGTLWPLYASFSITFWIGPCRVVRGEVLKLRELEYIQAATAVGFGRFYILLRHIVPNTAHLLLINFSLLFIAAIKSEVILSFLGLGVKRGPSWGIMISQASSEVVRGFFWQIGAATVFMFGLVLAFNVLTDALQDAFDPRHV